MSIVLLDGQSLDDFISRIVVEIKQELGAKPRDKWIDGDEAMQMLRIKSKTTLQKLRDEGKIRYSQPEPRIILYDSDSIDTYLEKHAKETF